MHKTPLFNKVIALLLILSLSILADDSIGDTLESMSFEDLMNVEVTVASRKAESIFDAPGMVTSYNAQDMAKLGYYTIGELADITPGYSSTYAFGEKGLETRGMQTGAFDNNRHLILVNGIPVNHVRANKAPIEEELSLLFADRVEFLRGPASALYGTSAYYGVINIIPAVPKLNGTLFRSRMSIGNEQVNRNINATVSHKSDSYIFSASGSYYEKLASESYFGGVENDNRKVWDDRLGISGMGSYELTSGPLQGLGAGMMYLSRTSGLGEHWGNMSHEMNNMNFSTFIAYLKYKHNFTDDLLLNSYVKYNRSAESGSFIRLSEESYNNFNEDHALLNTFTAPFSNYEFYVDVNWVNPVVDVSGGVNIDYRYATGGSGGGYGYSISVDPIDTSKEGYPYVVLPEQWERSDNYVTSSVFLQLQKKLPVLQGMILTGGVRGDIQHTEYTSYNQFSPRIALVQHFTNDITLKGQWGTALFAPGLKEIGLNNETVSQNPSVGSLTKKLEPETFSTLEAGLSYHPSISTTRHEYVLKVELAGYYNQSVNPLQQTQVLSTDNNELVNIYVNTNDTITSSGLETEFKASADYGIGAFLNYSLALAYNQDNDEITDTPTHRIQSGITWDWQKTGLFGALVGRHIHGYTTGDKNDRFPHSNFLDLNLGWQSQYGVGIEMQMKNMLNGEYHYPTNGQPGILLPARSVTITISANF